MKIKNTFWFRHFLMCNRIANLMMESRGWNPDNLARLIMEEDNGCFANGQMTVFFQKADEFLSELHSDEPETLFENLEDEGLSLEVLAKLTLEEIREYYNEYCIGRIDFSNLMPE